MRATAYSAAGTIRRPPESSRLLPLCGPSARKSRGSRFDLCDRRRSLLEPCVGRRPRSRDMTRNFGSGWKGYAVLKEGAFGCPRPFCRLDVMRTCGRAARRFLGARLRIGLYGPSAERQAIGCPYCIRLGDGLSQREKRYVSAYRTQAAPRYVIRRETICPRNDMALCGTQRGWGRFGGCRDFVEAVVKS